MKRLFNFLTIVIMRRNPEPMDCEIVTSDKVGNHDSLFYVRSVFAKNYNGTLKSDFWFIKVLRCMEYCQRRTSERFRWYAKDVSFTAREGEVLIFGFEIQRRFREMVTYEAVVNDAKVDLLRFWSLTHQFSNLLRRGKDPSQAFVIFQDGKVGPFQATAEKRYSVTERGSYFRVHASAELWTWLIYQKRLCNVRTRLSYFTERTLVGLRKPLSKQKLNHYPFIQEAEPFRLIFIHHLNKRSSYVLQLRWTLRKDFIQAYKQAVFRLGDTAV